MQIEKNRESPIRSEATTGVKGLFQGSLGYVCLWFVCNFYIYVTCKFFSKVYVLNWTHSRIFTTLLPERERQSETDREIKGKRQRKTELKTKIETARQKERERGKETKRQRERMAEI